MFGHTILDLPFSVPAHFGLYTLRSIVLNWVPVSSLKAYHGHFIFPNDYALNSYVVTTLIFPPCFCKTPLNQTSCAQSCG